MKIISIIGTRPEIIKMSPLFEALNSNFNHSILHSGQHYDPALDVEIFRELKLPVPKHRLKTNPGKFAEQMSSLMIGIQKILIREAPEYVIVQGDTNTSLCGALMAARLNIKVVHVEAGCRSNNMKSPEEQNRIIIDSISSLRFCSDKQSFKNLKDEGKTKNTFISGSTTFDALKRSSKLAPKEFYQTLQLKKECFVVATLHRAENLDDIKTFSIKIEFLNWIAKYLTVVFPVHPRTKKVLMKYKLKLAKEIIQCEPLSHLSFLNLLKHCKFVVSDSGGIQEEAAFFNKPCLILREQTEWMRLVKAKKNFLLTKLDSEDYKLAKRIMLDNKFYKKTSRIKSPESGFGSVEKIVAVLKRLS